MNRDTQERSRSRSPYTHNHARRHKHRHRSEAEHQKVLHLPLNARPLHKRDLEFYKPMFALYLDIQKRLDIDELPEEEVRGRWKSFVNKWNRAELAEGWYDPKTLDKAKDAHDNATDTRDWSSNHAPTRPSHDEQPSPTANDETKDESDDDNDDDFGPALPQAAQALVPSSDTSANKSGPTIPSLQDLQSHHEDALLAMENAREQRLESLRLDRKLDRKSQKERLEELVPRAEAGTHERQLEKKKELAASNRSFAASKEAGGDEDIPESDVMGGDDLSELKRMKKEQDKRKTEREIKRDEILRAKTAEREERSQKAREKEEKTMSMLRELARARFGDGNVQGATLRE